MKQLLLFLSFIFFVELSFAQEIESIKKEAEKTKAQREKNTDQRSQSGQHNNSGNHQNYNDEGSGLGGFCFNLLGGIIYTTNGNFNSKQLSRGIYRNRGFEFDLRSGFEPANLNLYAARFAYNTGAFSFDFRMNKFIQRNNQGNLASMNTFEFRPLLLNIINTNHLNLKLGAGWYIDPIGEDWALYSGSGDYYFKERFQIGFEYLYSGNSEFKARDEINFKLAYALLNKPSIRVDGFIFKMNQTYYGKIHVNTFGIGVNIRPNF